METHPGEGVMKEEKFPKSRKPLTGGLVGSFGISEHNITRREKKSTEYAPNPNFQQRSSLDTCNHHQQAGAGQEGSGCMLRVRTRPECPKDNLRELT